MATTVGLKITLTLNNCVRSGGVRDALAHYCEQDHELIGGEPNEALDACNDGFYFVDLDTGRAAEMNDAGTGIVWSDRSEVCLSCPSIHDAIDNPKMFAEMLKSVREVHNDKSDVTWWNAVASAIKACAALL